MTPFPSVLKGICCSLLRRRSPPAKHDRWSHNVTMQIPPRSTLRQYALPTLLLVASVITTTAVGARFMQNFLDGLPTFAQDSDLWPWPWLFHHPSNFLLGLPFSVALLAILLTHEFGHYFACRAHGIEATLPLVLPAPTLSGTVGAVIQIRDRIPDRLALMDVGVYGPLAGYLVSLVVVIIGFLLSGFAPGHVAPPQSIIGFGNSLTLTLTHSALAAINPGTPSFAIANRHPVLVAGWIGLFITSLNLIPAGQLDGGHILYAVSPRIYRTVSRILPYLLITAGIVFWVGWILWGLVLLLPAMRHPRVSPRLPLGRRRLILSALSLVVLVLTFSAAPFSGTSILHYLEKAAAKSTKAETDGATIRLGHHQHGINPR